MLLRTVLYVPGDRPDRIVRALASPADAVVVDLEDAVAPEQKGAARTATAAALALPADPDRTVGVRVNALDTGLLDDDLAALRPVWSKVSVLLLPMTRDAATVREVAARLHEVDGGAGPVLIPMVETAEAVLAAPAIAAAHTRVHTLALGPADLSAQLGLQLTPAGSELAHVRSALVLAAAAAGLIGPLDGPWLDVADDDGLAEAAQAGRRLGCTGMQVLHPRQLPVVLRAYTPSADQLARARMIVDAFAEASARGVASMRLPDGTFIDPPVAARASALLSRAPQLGDPATTSSPREEHP